jgi:hypothetical protein
MEIQHALRVGLRVRHARLDRMVTVVQCRDSRDPCTGEVSVWCTVRADDGQLYYASHLDLEQVAEQESLPGMVE